MDTLEVDLPRKLATSKAEVQALRATCVQLENSLAQALGQVCGGRGG